jgi:hypothetical protein
VEVCAALVAAEACVTKGACNPPPPTHTPAAHVLTLGGHTVSEPAQELGVGPVSAVVGPALRQAQQGHRPWVVVPQKGRVVHHAVPGEAWGAKGWVPLID